MNLSAHTFLLVEDNEDDVFLMQYTMKKALLSPVMHIAVDGKEAVNYLSGKEQYFDRNLYPIPTLVFLDLKLPYMHGFEVLEWIRKQEPLRNLPVIVLTSSGEQRDRDKARDLGAKAYLVKPPSIEMLRETIGSVLAIQ